MKIPLSLLYGDFNNFITNTGVSLEELIRVEEANLKALEIQYNALRTQWVEEDSIINEMINGIHVATILHEIHKKTQKKREKINRYKIELLKIK